MTTSDEVVNGLRNFLNGMATQSGLDPNVATQLSAITFDVNYAKTSPTQSEIDHLAAGDFPIYLLTATGQTVSSSEDVVSLMVSHRIPERTLVGRRQDADVMAFSDIQPYKSIEDDWTEQRQVLGFGIPGTYFLPNSQTRCRKLGVIKMQGFMTENLQFSLRKKKILSVLEHELGHMFGLAHENNTLMDPNYDNNARFDHYTNDQMAVVAQGLSLLLQ
jgi:hypothetical protein